MRSYFPFAETRTASEWNRWCVASCLHSLAWPVVSFTRLLFIILRHHLISLWFQSRWPQAVAQQMWASCSLHPGPAGFTHPFILSGSVHEYRLRLGRYKAGMCDAAWCAPCTWAPLQWAVPTKGRYSKCSTLPYLTLNASASLSSYFFYLSDNRLHLLPLTPQSHSRYPL